MRALVHSGGGAKGAYGVGALRHLLGNLQIQYDAYCGVSVGAINCAFLAQFASGQEKEAADQLVYLWSQIQTKDIYKRWWPFGAWHALWQTSMYDSSPLQQLIRKYIDLDKIRISDKKTSAGAVSLNSGKYTVFDQSSDHFIEAVIASASFPGMLMPVRFLDQLWSDGGIKEISPLKTAVDLGADTIDVIMTSPQTRIKKFIENPTTIDIMKRSIDLSSDKIMSNDIERMEMYNKLAEAGLTGKKYVKINIIRPNHNLIENLLDFDPIKIREMMQIGFEDAHKIG
jgi:NTE family protein